MVGAVIMVLLFVVAEVQCKLTVKIPARKKVAVLIGNFILWDLSLKISNLRILIYIENDFLFLQKLCYETNITYIIISFGI